MTNSESKHECRSLLSSSARVSLRVGRDSPTKGR
jgi:hypothetical protein